MGWDWDWLVCGMCGNGLWYGYENDQSGKKGSGFESSDGMGGVCIPFSTVPFSPTSTMTYSVLFSTSMVAE